MLKFSSVISWPSLSIAKISGAKTALSALAVSGLLAATPTQLNRTEPATPPTHADTYEATLSNGQPATMEAMAKLICDTQLPTHNTEPRDTRHLCESLSKTLSPDELIKLVALTTSIDAHPAAALPDARITEARPLLTAAAPHFTPTDAITLHNASGIKLPKGVIGTIDTLSSMVNWETGIQDTTRSNGGKRIDTISVIPSFRVNIAKMMLCYRAPNVLARDLGWLKLEDEPLIAASCTLLEQLPQEELSRQLARLSHALESTTPENAVIALKTILLPMLEQLPPEQRDAILGYITARTEQRDPAIIDTTYAVIKNMPLPQAAPTNQPVTTFTRGGMAGLPASWQFSMADSPSR